MKTMTIVLDDHVFRWSGGTFVAVWKAGRADEHVPDDMIELPEQLVKARTTREDITALAQNYQRSAR